MLIAYATAEGELASDVGAGAGPYARVLAEEIVKPGIEAVVMFRAVQRRVRGAIRQEPYLGFSALGDVYLAGKAGPAIPAPATPPQLQTGEAERGGTLERVAQAERHWAEEGDREEQKGTSVGMEPLPGCKNESC